MVASQHGHDTIKWHSACCLPVPWADAALCNGITALYVASEKGPSYVPQSFILADGSLLAVQPVPLGPRGGRSRPSPALRVLTPGLPCAYNAGADEADLNREK